VTPTPIQPFSNYLSIINNNIIKTFSNFLPTISQSITQLYHKIFHNHFPILLQLSTNHYQSILQPHPNHLILLQPPTNLSPIIYQSSTKIPTSTSQHTPTLFIHSPTTNNHYQYINNNFTTHSPIFYQ